MAQGQKHRAPSENRTLEQGSASLAYNPILPLELLKFHSYILHFWQFFLSHSILRFSLFLHFSCLLFQYVTSPIPLYICVSPLSIVVCVSLFTLVTSLNGCNFDGFSSDDDESLTPLLLLFGKFISLYSHGNNEKHLSKKCDNLIGRFSHTMILDTKITYEINLK